MNRCLKFIIKGKYGRFRRPYTTTSALSYSVIPPPQAKSILAAYLGIDRKYLYETIKNWKIAVEINNTIKKDTQSFNLTSNKGGLFRFPSNIEFLRDLNYTIYLYSQDKIPEFPKEPVFTPYLGCSEFICQIKVEKLLEFKAISDLQVETKSIIPVEQFTIIDIETSGQIFTDTIPVEINAQREYIKYVKVFYPSKGQVLKGTVKEIFKTEEGNTIYFF